MAEGYESLHRLGKTRDKSPEEGRLELLSSYTLVHFGGPYYQALQLPCPAGLNLFVSHPHHHKIITWRNNFLLDAVQPKVNSCLADFVEAEGCCRFNSHHLFHFLATSSCLACKSSTGKEIGRAWKELLSSVTLLMVPQGAVSVFLMGEAAINSQIKTLGPSLFYCILGPELHKTEGPNRIDLHLMKRAQ